MVTKPFSFIGGALCIDFVNTTGTWADGEPLRDKFATRHDLERWAQASGTVTPGTALTAPIFRRAIVLRRALYRIFTAIVQKRPPSGEDLETLNHELAVARSKECLECTNGAYRLQFPETPQRLLWAVVRSAAELLTSDNLDRLRQCPGDDCGWLFLDSSRNGMRQWCQMSICGNRAKARKFRKRPHPL